MDALAEVGKCSLIPVEREKNNGEEERARKKSYISRKMNDPKMIEVSILLSKIYTKVYTFTRALDQVSLTFIQESCFLSSFFSSISATGVSF